MLHGESVGCMWAGDPCWGREGEVCLLHGEAVCCRVYSRQQCLLLTVSQCVHSTHRMCTPQCIERMWLQVQEPLVALLGSMALALPAQALSLPLSLSLLIHCVGKANMAGAAPIGQTLVG